jgi:hypothetical protein
MFSNLHLEIGDPYVPAAFFRAYGLFGVMPNSEAEDDI